MSNLNPQERQILKVLLENQFLSTRQVAEKAGISWNTAKKYLDKFLEDKWIEHKSTGKKDYWKAHPPKEDD
jgi:predicted HTH transcriptional regulator